MSEDNKIHPVEQKLVPFNGAELLGVKANDGKVYIGVKWVCQGIGFDKSHSDAQVRKIQSDVVLTKGAVNLTLPTNGGIQDVLTIDLEYLPLWLAKISITPSMQVDQPEVAQKLIAYQLKAKDVLAAAFLPQQFNFENLSPELQAIFIVDTKVQKLDSRIEHLENHTTIDYGQQQQLTKAANAAVVPILGGKDSEAYKCKSLRDRVYQSLGHDYRDYFNINSRNNTYTKDFDRGLQYIARWTPPANLMREIEAANGQTLF